MWTIQLVRVAAHSTTTAPQRPGGMERPFKLVSSRIRIKPDAAKIAYCDYVYKRYGRFPARSGPFRTVLAYQAHHLDTDFYDHF